MNHFSRTATADYALRGQQIRAGDSVALFYASANRDEEVFPTATSSASTAIRTRTSASASASTSAWARTSRASTCGSSGASSRERCVERRARRPAELLHASFVGGPKHLPVRYRMRPAARH